MQAFMGYSLKQIKFDKQYNFLRQVVFLAGGFVPSEYFSQTTCLFCRKGFSTWLFFADKLIGVSLFHLTAFVCQAIVIRGDKNLT